MKKAVLLLLYAVLGGVFFLCPAVNAGAYEVRMKGAYWNSKPVTAGETFNVKISCYVLPNDGVVSSVSGLVTATSGISITGFAGPGVNNSSGSRFSFSGNGAAALGFDIKATVKSGATENESITVQSATVTLKNGEVFIVPGTTIKIPVSVPHTHTMEESSRTDATCTENGEVIYKCSGCGHATRETLPAKGHSYGEILTIAATCAQDGETYQTCSACQHKNVTGTIPMIGHQWKETQSKESTCSTHGRVVFACQNAGCGAEKAEESPPADHSFTGETLMKAANCTEDGKRYQRCAWCEAENVVKVLPKTGHDYVLLNALASACEADGWERYQCQNAHCPESEKKVILAATGHRPGSQITVEPSCEKEGEIYRVCGRCGAKQQVETLKALGHSWGGWTPEEGFGCEKGGQYERNCAVCQAAEQRAEAPGRHKPGPLSLLRKAACTEDGEMGTVCTVCKAVTYSVAVKAPGHKFVQWTRPDTVSCKTGWQETGVCAVCNRQKTRRIAAGEHVFAPWSVAQAASCTQKGERRHACTVCDVAETEEIPIKFHALGGLRIIRYPACEQAGEAGLFCRDCDYAEKHDLAVLGHDWGELSVPEGADCTAGWTGARQCKRTGCKAERSEDIPAGRHCFGAWLIDQEPGCLKEGLRRHVCELCSVEQTESIPAPGHCFGTPVLLKMPACEQAGESKLVCTVCRHTEMHPLAALGHDWQAIKNDPATCTENGHTERWCRRCDETRTEEIPVLAHQPGIWETVRAAACGVEGQRQTACLVCDAEMAETIPAPAHDFQPWVTKTPAACEKEGEEERLCALCGHCEKRVLPAGRHQLTLWVEEQPATCAAKGVYHRTCEVCDLFETMYTDAKPRTFGDWQKAEYADCTQGGVQRRACGACGQEETRPVEKRGHWMGAWQILQKAACETDGVRERACKRCGVKETGSLAATGHKAARKYTIVRKARAYHPGIREKLCARCGAVLEKKQYSPSLQSLKVVFSPAGIPLKDLLPGSTGQWYMLVPVDTKAPGTYRYPLVADNRHTVGEMTVTVSESGFTVSCAYPDDRTVVLKPMLRVFSSLADITPARIRRRVKGYALDKPISFDRFADAGTLYLYLRVEGVYDDLRAEPFDAKNPSYLARKDAMLRMVGP